MAINSPLIANNDRYNSIFVLSSVFGVFGVFGVSDASGLSGVDGFYDVTSL